jgi:hypothetical protein
MIVDLLFFMIGRFLYYIEVITVIKQATTENMGFSRILP